MPPDGHNRLASRCISPKSPGSARRTITAAACHGWSPAAKRFALGLVRQPQRWPWPFRAPASAVKLSRPIARPRHRCVQVAPPAWQLGICAREMRVLTRARGSAIRALEPGGRRRGHGHSGDGILLRGAHRVARQPTAPVGSWRAGRRGSARRVCSGPTRSKCSCRVGRSGGTPIGDGVSRHLLDRVAAFGGWSTRRGLGGKWMADAVGHEVRRSVDDVSPSTGAEALRTIRLAGVAGWICALRRRPRSDRSGASIVAPRARNRPVDCARPRRGVSRLRDDHETARSIATSAYSSGGP